MTHPGDDPDPADSPADPTDPTDPAGAPPEADAAQAADLSAATGAPEREPPGPPEPPEPAAPPRGLVRSADRYAGGVAAGIAGALDVDPLAVRLVLVIGTLYQPVVIAVYALAWLVLPDERTGASLLAGLRQRDGWRPVAGIVAAAVGAMLVAPDLGPGADDQALTAGVLLVALGALLVLRRPAVAEPAPSLGYRPPAGETPPDPAGSPLGAPARPVVAPLERLVRRRLDRRRRPPAHLGWLGLSALVVLAGVVAAVDRGIEPVAPGVAVSLGLVLVGVVLVAAARWGRARLLILPGLALLPLWVGFGLSAVPRYDRDGDVSYVVASRDDLRRSYEHGYGRMDVDLRAVSFEPGEHRALRLGLTAGTARLYVPAVAHLVIRGDFGIGQVEVYEDPYFWRMADSGGVVARETELRVGDAQPVCTEQLVYAPPPTDYTSEPPEVVGTEHRTPWGEPCEPQPPVEDPPVLEVSLDVGIGSVEVHREAA